MALFFLLCWPILQSSELFSLDPHFLHLNLENYEDLDGDEDVFFSDLVLYFLDTMCNKCGNISAKAASKVPCSYWFAKGMIWSYKVASSWTAIHVCCWRRSVVSTVNDGFLIKFDVRFWRKSCVSARLFAFYVLNHWRPFEQQIGVRLFWWLRRKGVIPLGSYMIDSF